MEILSVLKRNDIYVPVWNDNRSLSASEQIQVYHRWPTTEDLAGLPTLSGAAALAALVLVRVKNLGTWNAMSLTGMIQLMVKEEWAQGLSVPLDMDEQSLRLELLEFAKVYCRTFVSKVTGLESLEIIDGPSLLAGPAELLPLVLESAFHIWGGQTLEKKSSGSPSGSPSKASGKKASKASSKTARQNRIL